MTAKIPLLVLCPLQPEFLVPIDAAYERIDGAAGPAARASAIAAHGHRVRAVLTIGTIGLTGEEMAAMPALELVCTLGVGYEKVDLPAARARGLVVANGAGTNADVVADHAFGLLIAAVRGIVALDRGVREGLWRDAMEFYTPTVSGKRLGVLGFGAIGTQLAQRAAGFGMPVGYFSRSRKPHVPHDFFETPAALARWCDFMVVATPGGPDTHHLVDAEVLQALGSRGCLVNIARGSVVDTEALAQALKDGTLGAAGIDVYESEPARPDVLMDCPNLVITPHIAGRSPEAVMATVNRFLANAAEHFAGRPPVTPVP